MSRKIAGWLWVAVFFLIFSFSIDLWAWKGDFIILGWPYTVAYPFFLCLCLSVLFYMFCSHYWKEGGS